MSWRIRVILLSILELNTNALPKSSTNEKAVNLSTLSHRKGSSPDTRVRMFTRIQYDGHRLRKNDVVPAGSRVTLSCKVSFRRAPENFFNVMLIGFRLPSGEHVVPGNCIVMTRRPSKRCKMVMKKVKVTDQGTYRCLAYYNFQGNLKKIFKDIDLSVTTDGCPSLTMCKKDRKCLHAVRECKNKRKCSSSQFGCNDGRCIEKQYRCDDIPDCPDGSDEDQCELFFNKCNETGHFVCNNGQHLLSNARCNGLPECEDKSDEIDCGTCPEGFVQCATGENCLPVVCDQLNETIYATSNERKSCAVTNGSVPGCSTGKCVKKELICNGIVECKDDSDEQNCGSARTQTKANVSISYASEAPTWYVITLGLMLFLTVVIVLLSIWIQRKRKILENRISTALEVHVNAT